jgi:hypothetical protein
MATADVREILRRVAIWATAGAFVAVAVAMLILVGDSYVLAGWTGFPIVGAIILTARPRNNVGRALLSVGALWLIAAAAFIPVDALGDRLPHDIQAILSIIGSAAGFLAFLALSLTVVLFPTGSVRTRLGWAVLWALAAFAVVIILVTALLPAPPDSEMMSGSWAVQSLAWMSAPAIFAMNIVLPIPLAAALIDLVMRWRRAGGIERLQYRWFAFGVSVVLLLFIVDQVLQNFAPALYESIAPLSWLIVAMINAIPVTIGIAVTRHGLFEINRIVSRTVAYTVVTAGAIGVYALVVTSATWLIPDAPSIAVAAATLIAAALFLPALRGVQRVVDRRFDRERYDAVRIVDAFGEQLRTAVDPAGTTRDLATAVDKALQPASLGLWTREANHEPS